MGKKMRFFCVLAALVMMMTIFFGCSEKEKPTVPDSGGEAETDMTTINDFIGQMTNSPYTNADAKSLKFGLDAPQSVGVEEKNIVEKYPVPSDDEYDSDHLFVAQLDDNAEVNLFSLKGFEEELRFSQKKKYSSNHIFDQKSELLIFHGSSDKLVPIEEIYSFESKMQILGSKVFLVEFKGQGHGFFNKNVNKNIFSEVTEICKQFF